MFLFVVFLSLLSQCHKAQGYSRITFCYNKNNYEGQRLNATVHRVLNALSEFDCAAHCYHNACCRSANFRKIPSVDGTENCELLHAVEWEEPGNLQENETYDYLMMLQPQRSFDCTCLSCKNGGTCDQNTKKCSCRLGFAGKRCEKGYLQVYIKSEGKDDTDGQGLAVITVNGIDYANKARGHNIVVVNAQTGIVESASSFDTHAVGTAADEMAHFLKTLQKRKLVLIAIQDEGSRNMNNAAYNALITLGAINPLKKNIRSSYAQIGWTGPGQIDVIGQVQNPQYNGPSIIDKIIPLPP